MVVKLVTTEKRDNFQKSTSLQGPDLSNVRYKSLFLRATKFDAGSSIYQVYVRDQYAGQWRFYNSAYDIDGNKLEFTSIKREAKVSTGLNRINRVKLAWIKSVIRSLDRKSVV